MRKNNSRFEFFSLLMFVVLTALVLTNGFMGRISAQQSEADVYQTVEPIAEVLYQVLDHHVYDPDLDKVVEGALRGMLGTLDNHSSFISQSDFNEMREETEGQFEGIGIHIDRRIHKTGYILIREPIENSPAGRAGILPGDLITKIDGVTTMGLTVEDAVKRIKGAKGTVVRITVLRQSAAGEEEIDFDIKRGTIPLQSISEARMLDGGVVYIRFRDFKKNTDREIREEINKFKDQGMKSLVLDMRLNPGGLLGASKEVCDLFLPRGSLVTYTKGRDNGDEKAVESSEYKTDGHPIIPPTMPMVVLVSQGTASSAEIVTGALQFWERAIVIGTKTYGKGSVQTVIPLNRPKGSAIRLTTALYYTPAGVTIHEQGIKPDVEVAMSEDQIRAWVSQMYDSYSDDLSKRNEQNHGSVTGTPYKDMPLTELIGSWADLGDHEAQMEALRANKSRQKIISEVAGAYPFTDFWSRVDVLRTKSGGGAELVGKSIQDIANERDEDPYQVFTDILLEAEGDVECRLHYVDDLPLKRAVDILREGGSFKQILEKYHRDVRETQVAAAPEDAANVEPLPKAQ